MTTLNDLRRESRPSRLRCICGAETEVYLQVRITEKTTQHKSRSFTAMGKHLRSKARVLCVPCAVRIYDHVESEINR